MIEFDNKPYVLSFTELGDYDEITLYFKTLEQAKKEQKELILRHGKPDGYFTEISKLIIVRRKEPTEKEQMKKYGF